MLSRLAHEVALTANGFSCSSRLSVALLPHSLRNARLLRRSDPIRRPPIGRIDRSQTKSRWSDYADRCGCGEWATGGNARPQSRVECNARLLSAAGNCCSNHSTVHKTRMGRNFSHATCGRVFLAIAGARINSAFLRCTCRSQFTGHSLSLPRIRQNES